MEMKFDFGNAVRPAAPPADAPLHASIDGIAFALGAEECVFRPRGGDEPHVMTLDVLAALAATRSFRTLDEHVREVAAQLPQLAGRHDVIRAVLGNLVDRGLLASADGLLDRLAALTRKAPVPAPFRGIVIRTCDRPARLAALLESLAINESRHRGGHRLIVIDDSRDPTAVARNAELVREYAGRTGVDSRHVAPGDWTRVLDRWRRAVPESTAAIDELLAREAAGGVRPGGGKGFNLALLLAAGARFALLDDDFLLPLRRHGGNDRRLRVDQELAPASRFHASLDAALSDGEPLDADPIATHLGWCGQALGAVFADDAAMRPARIDLRGLESARLGALGGDTRILATINGHRGHSGSAGRDWLFLLSPSERAGFADDREHYLATLARPNVVFADDAFVLAARSVFTPFMIDASALLAPTIATGRNEDYLFGALNQALWPSSRVLRTPYTIGHRQDVAGPARAPRVAADAAALAEFVGDWLTQRGVEVRGADPARRLGRIADLLDDLADSPTATRADLLSEYLAMRRSDLVRRLQEAFAGAEGAPVWWQADVRERIEANGKALVSAAPPRLAGWPDTLDVDGCAERLATELCAFTRALRGWPALFAHATARGERVLDDLA
jgi:hypothetical protein